MIQELNVNEVVEFVSFGFSCDNEKKICCNGQAAIPGRRRFFTNLDITLEEPMSGTVIKRWDDYETGEKSWVRVNKKLQKLLNKHKYITDIVFVGEFDLVRQNKELIEKLNKG